MHVVLVVQQGENYEKRRNSDEYSRLHKFDKWDKEGCVQGWHVLEFEACSLGCRRAPGGDGGALAGGPPSQGGLGRSPR